MKFKEIEIIKENFFNFRIIASYHDYFQDQAEMIDKISASLPNKGDVIKILVDKHPYESKFLTVKRRFIDYIDNKLTIWCK